MIPSAVECGLNVPWSPAGIDGAARLGIGRARIGWETGWSWPDLQALLDNLHAKSLKVTVSVTPSTRRYGEPGYPATCARVAKMLRPGDILEGHNECNHFPFAATPDAAGAAKDFTEALLAVRSAAPTVPFILGGLSPESGPREFRQFTIDMVNKAPRVNGVSGVLLADGQGLHTYVFPSDPMVSDPWNMIAALDQNLGALPSLAGIWAYAKRPSMPIHITEFGAPSGRSDLGSTGKPDPQYPGLPYRYSEAFQEAWLVKYLQAFRRSAANITTAQWYRYEDGVPGAGSNWDPYTGIVSANGTDKLVTPVFRAWAASVGRVS